MGIGKKIGVILDKMNRSLTPPVVLIVADDKNAAETLSRGLESYSGCKVVMASKEEAVAAVRKAGGKIELIVADCDSGDDCAGIKVLSELRAGNFNIPAIVVSSNDGVTAKAKELGARYFPKSNSANVLHKLIGEMLDGKATAVGVQV